MKPTEMAEKMTGALGEFDQADFIDLDAIESEIGPLSGSSSYG